MPKINLLRGEAHRERVLTALGGARYLALPLTPSSVHCTILIDTGMRPEECFR